MATLGSDQDSDDAMDDLLVLMIKIHNSKIRQTLFFRKMQVLCRFCKTYLGK